MAKTKEALYRFFLLCFSVCWQVVAAQPTVPFTFAHYTMSSGLTSNETRSVVQDRTGYIWISSNNGLQRYDGVNYKTFQHHDGDPTSLPSNGIWQIVIDRDDNLWVLTYEGQAGIFDKSSFTYMPVPVKFERPASLTAMKQLIKDENGNLFLIFHDNELLLFDKGKKAFVPATSMIPLRPEWRITSLAQQPGTQKYWLGLTGGGVAIYNQQTKHLSYAGNNVEHEAAVDSLQRFHRFAHFLFDKKSRLWFVDWEVPDPFPKIVCFHINDGPQKVQTFEFATALKTYHEIHDFLQQDDGIIWVRGALVLARFNEAKKTFELIPNDSRSGLGIVYDQITNLFEDREKNIWISTGNDGLYRCNPSQQFFNNVFHPNPKTDQPAKGSIMSFIEMKNGDVLVGTWGDGMFRYNNQLQPVPFGIKDTLSHGYTAIWGMCRSADSNTIWMASQPGIYRFDQAKGEMTYRNPAALQNRTVRQVAEDKQGNLWLGMHYFGLCKWLSPKDGGKDSVVKISDVGNELVTNVIADDHGLIWVTTERKGVYAFESETDQIRFHWTNRTKADSTVLMEGFTSVLPYNDSLVYISTNTRLYKFNRNTNKIAPQPLPSSLLGTIAAIEKDNEGLLWISTSNGIYRYSFPKKTMVFFNRDDGIANDRFIIAASYRTRNGRMLFGADNSFIHFDPSQIKSLAQNPKVVLTNIQIGRRELPVDSVLKLDVLRLGAAENSLAVDFSSLTYTAYRLVQYKLEGIDKEWHTADRDNKASFPFLPPGQYTLLLRSINAEGESSAATVLSIYIAAPFYQTWWFYTALGLATALLLFWLDRQRMRRKEAMQKVRTDIAGGLHQEVNTALSNINILSEIARLKSEREPQKAKDYLEQIHTKSHNMMIALDDMLWSLDPENDAMDKTVQRIREHADAVMQRHSAVIELLIDKKIEGLHLNMKLRHEAFLLFKEGLHSLMDAGTKYCIVHLTSERGKLLFTIEFENEQCNFQKLNNLLQRRDMEERLHQLKAKLDVQVHKSRSVFLLQLPL